MSLCTANCSHPLSSLLPGVPSAVDRATEGRDAGPAADTPWDTADPFFTARTRDLLVTVFKCYVRQSVICFGLPGNVICCIVFWKQGLSDRINLLLFWLAVIDFCNLTFQIPNIIHCHSSDTVLLANVDTIMVGKTSRIFVCCGIISGNLIVVMSVERCLFVVIPFKARRLLTYWSMVIAISICYLIPFLASLPLFLGDTIKWRLDPSTNRSVAYIIPTSWFPAGRFQVLIVTYLTLIAQPLSFVIVAVCSSITIVHLRQSSLKRSEMTAKSERRAGSGADNRLTVMLLFLCVVYAVVCFVGVCSGFILSLEPEFFIYRKYHNSFVVYFEVLQYPLSCVNSTVNFCAYLVLSSRFRSTLKEMSRPAFLCRRQ